MRNREKSQKQTAADEPGLALEQLAAILDEVSDGVTIQEPSGRLIYANEKAAQATGYSSVQHLLATPPAEVLKKFELMDAGGAPFPADRLPGRLVLQGLVSEPALIRFRHIETGEERWCVLRAIPIRNAQGQVLWAVNIFHDITEQRQADRRLQVSEQRYRSLFDHNPDAVFSLNPDGTFQSLNPGAEAISGYRREELLGRPFAPLIAEKDRERTLEGFRRALQGESAAFEVTITHRAGHRMRLAITSIPVVVDGAVVGVYGVAKDISGPRRAERALHFLSEASALLAASLDYKTTLQSLARLVVPELADWCIVYILDEEGKVRRLAVEHAEPAMESLAREIQTQYPLDPDAEIGVPKVLRTGEPEFYPDVTLEVLTADVHESARAAARLEPLQVSSWICVPLVARGRTIGAISLLTTISRRRYDGEDLALAEELARRAAVAVDNARLYQDAQEAIELRDQFLSIASHELKTPLTALLGYTEILQRRANSEDRDERERRALQTIHDQAGRLRQLIERLMDLSRIQTGQLRVERDPVNLAFLLSSLIDGLRPGLKSHTLELCFEGDAAETEALVVKGDEMRLEQVFRNLLDNAIKYSPEGGTIRVLVRRESEGVVVAIVDQGIGIPPEALSQLFSLFYRVGNVASRRIGGMGLGLYIVQQIVDAHGGRVEVESEPGEGSVFRVFLPLSAPGG